MYAGQTAVFATQHEKEKIFQRPVVKALGLTLCVPKTIDTDQFGTFSGEIPRTGTMLDALNAKANLGMELTGLTLAFASEGSFGPHPQNPFFPADREIALFIDKERDISIHEQVLSYQTNYASLDLTENFSAAELHSFLERIRFPEHAIILKQFINGQLTIHKGIQQYDQLLAQLKIQPVATIETDMRAHLNPLRRRVICELAFKLVRRILSACPSCQLPGWGLVGAEAGLRCADCGASTQLVKHEIFGCGKCMYREARPAAHGLTEADPQYCDFCNP